MPRGLSVCQQCGSSMPTKMFVCPECGTPRVRKGTHPHGPVLRSTLADDSGVDYHQQKIVVCDICGEQVGQAGIGSHRSRMHGVVGPNAKYYKPRVGGGEWTVSLVNGKKQIAAKVTDAVAKRIIGMLF